MLLQIPAPRSGRSHVGSFLVTSEEQKTTGSCLLWWFELHVSVLFITSLTQTAGYEVAAFMIVFSRLWKRRCFINTTRNWVKSCSAEIFFFHFNQLGPWSFYRFGSPLNRAEYQVSTRPNKNKQIPRYSGRSSWMRWKQKAKQIHRYSHDILARAAEYE